MPTSSPLPLTLSFLAGILLTLTLAELYPDLQQLFRARRKHTYDDEEESSHEKASGEAREVRGGGRVIGEGIESCIGNTPLFRIKSLSEETGCEILGKAEVRFSSVVNVQISKGSSLLCCFPQN